MTLNRSANNEMIVAPCVITSNIGGARSRGLHSSTKVGHREQGHLILQAEFSCCEKESVDCLTQLSKEVALTVKLLRSEYQTHLSV